VWAGIIYTIQKLETDVLGTESQKIKLGYNNRNKRWQDTDYVQ